MIQDSRGVYFAMMSSNILAISSYQIALVETENELWCTQSMFSQDTPDEYILPRWGHLEKWNYSQSTYCTIGIFVVDNNPVMF